MPEFYKKSLFVFFTLTIFTSTLSLFCLNKFFISKNLFPRNESAYPWKLVSVTDAGKGGKSSVQVNASTLYLDFNYNLSKYRKNPYVSAILGFDVPGNASSHINLSQYTAASFYVVCSPKNTLAFNIHSFDKKATDRLNFSSYRNLRRNFSCNEEGGHIEIDLKSLNTPIWWLSTFHLNASDQNYRLDDVLALSFRALIEGPFDTPAHVRVSELSFKGYDWRYFWGVIILVVLIYVGYCYWLVKQYGQHITKKVREKLVQNKPFVAYQKLSIEPYKDKEKTRLLSFMAQEFSNHEMSLSYSEEQLGINRTKINELLKQELGLTFSAYLNKLRLADAARLLYQSEGGNVAQVAHRVGYNNVTYFYKLFKKEYGRSPKGFKGRDSA